MDVRMGICTQVCMYGTYYMFMYTYTYMCVYLQTKGCAKVFEAHGAQCVAEANRLRIQ